MSGGRLRRLFQAGRFAVSRRGAMVGNASKSGKGARGHPARSGRGILRTIAVFKLIKALLLIGVGLGAFRLLNPATADIFDHWVSALAGHFGPKAVVAVHGKLSSLRNSQLIWVGIAAFLYSALFVVEGVGLWMARRWAEYLTIIATSSFVPFEIYELFRRLNWQRAATLAINLLVVAYL